MNQKLFDEDQINNNTWDEYSNQLIVEYLSIFGIPQSRKINEDQFSIIYLDYQSETSENQNNNQKKQQTPKLQKRIKKNLKFLKERSKQNQTL